MSKIKYFPIIYSSMQKQHAMSRSKFKFKLQTLWFRTYHWSHIESSVLQCGLQKVCTSHDEYFNQKTPNCAQYTYCNLACSHHPSRRFSRCLVQRRRHTHTAHRCHRRAGKYSACVLFSCEAPDGNMLSSCTHTRAVFYFSCSGQSVLQVHLLHDNPSPFDASAGIWTRTTAEWKLWVNTLRLVPGNIKCSKKNQRWIWDPCSTQQEDMHVVVFPKMQCA